MDEKIIIFVILAIILVYLCTSKREDYDEPNDVPQKSITVKNFLNVPLTAQYITDQEITKDYEIKAKTSTSIDIPIENVYRPKLRFLLDGKIFADYVLTLNEQILYIGLVTTKYQYMATSYWPIKDMPELRIHNLTAVPLSFNGHIVVPPREMMTYEGREQSGIAAGFVMNNDEDIFLPFQIRRPVTDIYYGIISNQWLPTYTYRHMRI